MWINELLVRKFFLQTKKRSYNEMTERYIRMTEQSNLQVHLDASIEKSSERLQKWGAVTSFLLIFAFIIPQWIYLVGNLQDAFGPFVYSLADFLFGPIWAVSLVTII